jgi:prolyl-tRNA synthetase
VTSQLCSNTALAFIFEALICIRLRAVGMLGIPHTIVLGDRNLDNDDIEYKYRRNGEKQLIKTGDIVDYLVKQIKG